MKLEKENNMDWVFKRVSNLFKKKTNEVSEKITGQPVEVTDKKLIKEQQQKASDLLSAKLYNIYFEMVKNGYQETEGQKEIIANYVGKKVKEVLSKDYYDNTHKLVKRFEDFDKILDNGYQMSNTMVYQLLSAISSNSQIKKELFLNQNIEKLNYYYDIQKTPVFEKASNTVKQDLIFVSLSKKMLLIIKDKVDDEEFQQFMSKKFLKTFKVEKKEIYLGGYETYSVEYATKKSINDCLMLLKLFPQIIKKQIPFDDYVNFLKEFQQKKENLKELVRPHVIDEVERLLNQTLEKYYINDVKEFLNDTKEIYMDALLEAKTIEKAKAVFNNYGVRELPKSANNIIEQIRTSFNNLKGQGNLLNNEDRFLIENLFEKRIPEILQQYFSLTPEYRETLKNDKGETSLDLMNEALMNYKDKLEAIVLKLNIEKMRELNVAKNYSKNIK